MRRRLLAAIAAAATLAGPAPAIASGCPDRDVTRPFASWADLTDNFLAPDGGFENGAAGWTLEGRAAVVAGNEPFMVNGRSDSRALRLPAGGSATSAPICVAEENRTTRFFALGDGTPSSSMLVDMVFRDAFGAEHALPIGVALPTASWSPTLPMPLLADLLAANSSEAAVRVRLRFTPIGPGSWLIDDLFVDPYRMR